MRISIGGIWHESNTFAPQPTRLAQFEELTIDRGPAMLDHWRETEHEVAGILDVAEAAGAELAPTVFARSWPSGTIDRSVYDALLDEMITGITRARPDGVVLVLHGAAVVDGLLEADGHTTQRVRDAVGRDVPITVALDFHANVSPAMIDVADAVAVYRTYPHIDRRETGARATSLLLRILRGEISPVVAVEKIPILPHILKQETAAEPMRSLEARAREIEAKKGVLAVDIVAGFAWADVPTAGMSVVATTDGDEDSAASICRGMADAILARRADFHAELTSVDEAATAAAAADAGPVILVDIGDNIGGGTPGDGTMLLDALLRAGARDAVVTIADPESVERCRAAGVRSHVALQVGGKTDRLHGEPAAVEGTVRRLCDGVYRNIGQMRDGIVDDQGLTAVVDCGGVTLMLTSLRMVPWNLEQLRSCGIEPTRARSIVLKAAVAYRAAYVPIAARVITVDTPGLTSPNLSRFTYKHLPPPLHVG